MSNTQASENRASQTGVTEEGYNETEVRDRRHDADDRPVEGCQAETSSRARDDRLTTGSSDRSLVGDPETLRRKWESVQVGFVDDPRQAFAEAERLVASTIEEMEQGFRQQHERLEAGWSDGGEASTDDLREAFQRYRDFFDRLLQV